MALFKFGKKKTEKAATAMQPLPRRGKLYQETDVYGLVSFMTNMPDIDETLNAAGIFRRDLKRLETDDEISTALETRLFGMMSTPWRFEGDDKTSIEFIQEQITPILEPFMRNVWSAIPYGYNVSEVIYKPLDGGKIGINKVLYKPFYWFQPRSDGELSPYGMVDDVLDTRFKFMLTRRNPTYVQPYGEALLSRLYWPWFYRQVGWEHWMRWLARYGTPPLIGEGVGNQLDLLREALSGAVDAAALAVPEGTKVTVANAAAGASHFPDFELAVTKRVQKLILGQTLTTDVGKTGSFAAAKVHDGVRDDKRLSDAKLVTGTVQHLVDALVALNNLQPVTFVMEDGRELNPERATRDATLASAGIASFSRDYLLRAYDFDEDDLEDIAPQPKPAMSASFQFADGQPKFTPAQNDVESLGDATVAQSQSPISDDAIKMAIKSSETAEDMMNKLATLAEGYSPEAFAELTERALFAADVFGFVQSAQGKH